MMETQSGWREAFAPATLPQDSQQAEGLIEMLHQSHEEERAPGVDESMARVVRIIVEQYDGDVKAFVESNRYRIEANRRTKAASDHGDEAALRKCPPTTKIIGRISRVHYS